MRQKEWLEMGRVFSLFLVLLTVGTGYSQSEDEVRRGAQDFIDNARPLHYGGVMETGNTFGGIPHFSFGIGMNIMKKVNFIDPNDTTNEISFLGLFPYFYGGIGLYKGLSLSPLVKGVGSVDFLFKWIPPVKIDDPKVKENPSFLSYGVRIGILKDGLVTPGISFTLKRTTFGKLRVEEEGVPVPIWTEMSFSATSLYLSLSKSILFITPYLALGKDWYELPTTYAEAFEESKINPNGSSSRFVLGLKVSLLLLKVFGEVGFYGNKNLVSLGAKIGI
jgi:hypothetical protein